MIKALQAAQKQEKLKMRIKKIANHLKYKIRKIMITLSKNTMKIVEKKKNAWKMRQNYITNFR